MIAGVLIYVKKRKGLKQKAEAKKKMEYIFQISSPAPPATESWPASSTANSRENVLMLSKAKVQQKDHENAAVPGIFIEFAPKGYHPENTFAPVENKEENQSIKDLDWALGQNIEDNKRVV